MRIRREVDLHTKTGHTFRGILANRWATWLRLDGGVLVTEDGATHDVQGQVLVHRSNVDWVAVIR